MRMQYFTAAIFCALALFGAATAAGEESGLQVNVSKEEIRGTFAIGENQRLEFYTKIEGKYIISATIFNNLTSGMRVQLTSLRLPVASIHDRKIEHMLEDVLDAARLAATVFLEVESLPPISNTIVNYYYQFADALFKPTDELGSSQLRFSLMYHSAIMGSAKRITDGTQDPKDICSVATQYYYGDGLFVCSQDLESTMSEETPNRQKRAYWPRGRRPPSGRHWGCCGNYYGRCWLWGNLCWWHDCVCQCCSRWFCGWACRREWWCITRFRRRCY